MAKRLAEVVEDAYLRTLSRFPDGEEKDHCNRIRK